MRIRAVVALDLIALPRKLLEEDGKLDLRVLLGHVQKQPKRLRANQILDEIRLR